MMRAAMNALRTLTLGLVLSAGCSTGGYQILTGTKAAQPSAGPGVVLYGVEGEGNPPPGCRVLGTVRAWSEGEKTFPYDQLRAAAAELGGDSVMNIQPDPSATNPKKPTQVGTVARCRS
jgi:hypothetical protein